MKKQIVIDCDDVLWDLNSKASRLANINIEKLTCFNAYENPNLTDEERRRLIAAYAGTDLYKNIVFDAKMIKLVNDVYHTYPEYEVMISSNCGSITIRDMKMDQLSKVLDLPENQIHLHVIDIKTQSTQKKFSDNIFILIDDSIHNIMLAKAQHSIMPAKNWNSVLENQTQNNCTIDRPTDSAEIAKLVYKYISEDREH